MSAKSKIVEPFLILPGLALPSLSEPLATVVEAEEAIAAVEKARAGLSSLKAELKTKTAELASLRSEVSGAGGKALAAARMGIASSAPAASGASAEAGRSRINALEEEVGNIESAIDQAPELFVDVQGEMNAARAKLGDAYNKHVAGAVDTWCAQATAALEAALKQVESVRSMSALGDLNSYGSSVEGIYADLGEFAQRASKAFVTANRQNYPLVPPPPPAPVMADDRKGLTVRPIEDPKEWFARREREEAAREAQERKRSQFG